jgi:hypothetical protein
MGRVGPVPSVQGRLFAGRKGNNAAQTAEDWLLTGLS